MTRWLQYWIEMICGLVGVLTLGFYRPWWDYQFIIWATKRRAKKTLQGDRRRPG